MPKTSLSTLLQEAHESLVIQRHILKQARTNVKNGQEPDEVRHTLCMLFHYMCDRGGAVLALVSNRLDWDAEIILRTYYECAAKIMFVTLTSPEKQKDEVWEYWIPLGEAADRKAARKAGFAEQVFPDGDKDNRDVFRLLQDPRMVRNAHKLTKAERRRLEHKWSFSELIEVLSQMKRGNRQLTGVRSLLHMYGMASHLAHADCKAMDLMTDRALRAPDELLLLQESHAARIISDSVSLGTFCAILIGEQCGAVKGGFTKLRQQMNVTVDAARAIREDFYVTQRSFYDEMLSGS